ncbi:MAG: SIMPL domain-containing protein [Acinetobacter sp.]
MSKFLSYGLIIASASSFIASTTFAQDNPPPNNLINLQADATREVSNDQMQAILYIEKNNRNPSELASQVTQALNQAFAISRQYPQVKVTTGTQNTQPIYDDKNKLKEWRAHAEIQLISTDFKATSQLMSQLQNSFQTDSVNFSVSEKLRKKVENELIVEASKSFQQRAQLLSQAWNKSSYQLINLNLNTSTNRPQPYLRANLMKASAPISDSAPTQEVSAGESKISVSANGSIELR